MKTWNRNGYVIEERQYNLALNKFCIIVDDEVVDEIIPEDKQNMIFIKSMLDDGEDFIGWEDGSGGRINLTYYEVSIADKYNEWADSTTVFESYSKKQVIEAFNNQKLNKNEKVLMGYHDENDEFITLMERTS